MKAWMFGGRARPTQIRIHMSRCESNIIESALWEAYSEYKDPEIKKVLFRYRDADRKAKRIVLGKAGS